MRLLHLLLALADVLLAAELVHIQSIWRHGDRVPVGTFPTDPNQRSAWPVRWGGITNTGMLQLFHQGLRLKERYIDELQFISANYSSDEIHVQSSDTDRTLISAYAFMAAFYSESRSTYPSAFRWPKDWTPIPVHTVSIGNDPLLVPWMEHCPRRGELMSSQESNPEYAAFQNENQPFAEALSEKSGWNLTDFNTFVFFSDLLYVEKLHNLSFAPWITDEVYEKVERIRYDAWDYRFGEAGFGRTENTELVALNGGRLLQQLIDNMLSARDRRSQIRYHAYSAHDMTISSLFYTLGAKQAIVGRRLPEYAASVVLELWKDEKNEFAVRLLYSRNSTSPLTTVTPAISGCPDSDFCPLETFIARSAKYAFRQSELQKMCAAKA